MKVKDHCAQSTTFLKTIINSQLEDESGLGCSLIQRFERTDHSNVIPLFFGE